MLTVRALRVACWLGALGLAFALAAWFQRDTLAELRGAREHANALAEGTGTETPVGLLGARHGVITLGRAEGASPDPTPRAFVSAPAAPVEHPQVAPPANTAGTDIAPPSGARRLTVGPGDTLSRLAQRHYGRHDEDLLRALARLNGLASPSELPAGSQLELPPWEQLGLRQPPVPSPAAPLPAPALR